MAQYKTPMTRGERTGLIILFTLLGMILLVMFMTRRCGSDPGGQMNDSIMPVTALPDSFRAEPPDSTAQKHKRRKESKKNVKGKETEPPRSFLDEPVN